MDILLRGGFSHSITSRSRDSQQTARPKSRDRVSHGLICKTKTMTAEQLTRGRFGEQPEKRLDGRPIPPSDGDREIVFFLAERNETEPGVARDLLNGDTPIGPALGHRGRDRVVRFHFNVVSRRLLRARFVAE